MPVRRHPVATAKDTQMLTSMPLNLPLAQRLKATYRLVRTHDLRLAEIFYTKLFQAAPHLRSLFGSDLTSQARKLTSALDIVVANLERPSANATLLAELGRRHAGYGAKPEHYDLVIQLLIESMESLLGPSAEPSALEEWRIALRLVSDQMIAAASIAPAPNLPQD